MEIKEINARLPFLPRPSYPDAEQGLARKLSLVLRLETRSHQLRRAASLSVGTTPWNSTQRQLGTSRTQDAERKN